MDGYEVCSKLKANARTHNIPVIFISALSDVLDKVKAFGVGGVDYITKPFQVEEVLARVETHLALQSLQNSLRDKNEELAKTLQQLQSTQEKLTIANQEISALNEKLKEENLRMRAELEVTKQLQQMILPKQEELESIEELEIAGYMEAADEVGGDYYDVLRISLKLCLLRCNTLWHTGIDWVWLSIRTGGIKPFRTIWWWAD